MRCVTLFSPALTITVDLLIGYWLIRCGNRYQDFLTQCLWRIFFIIRMTIASVKVSNYFSEWIVVSFAKTFLIKTNIYLKEFLFNFQLQSFIVNFTFTVLISIVLMLSIETPISKIKELIFNQKTKTKLNSENINHVKKL